MIIKTSVGTCRNGRCHNQDDKRDLKYCITEHNIREILGYHSGAGEDLIFWDVVPCRRARSSCSFEGF